MKILLINKFAYQKGGAEHHVLALKDLLEQHGHSVILFSMRDPSHPSPVAENSFVSFVDFERVRFSWQGLRAAGRMLYSFEARRKLRRLCEQEKPDIAHCHNIYHQLSPSILLELKRQHIPVVMTLHDFKLITPTYNLYAHHGLCTHALGGRWYQCFLHRCTKHSYAASALEMFEMMLHKMFNIYETTVDVFCAPSIFLRDMILQYNPRVRDIRLLPNFLDNTTEPQYTEGSYALYVGRLSEEKGVEDLLTAAREIPYPIRIVGDGPLRERCEKRIHTDHLQNVQLLGHKGKNELRDLYRDARFVVVPSRCYENQPLAVLEAYRAGKPVVVPDHGGFRELIQDGVTGYCYQPGSPKALRDALLRMINNSSNIRTMGERAWEQVQPFASDRYYRRLLTIYEELLSRR